MNDAPSVNRKNESLRNTRENDNGDDENVVAATALLLCSAIQAAGSPSNRINGTANLTKNQETLNTMIAILAPNFGQELQSEEEKHDSMSDAETKEGDNDGGAADDNSNTKKGGDVGDDDGDDLVLPSSTTDNNATGMGVGRFMANVLQRVLILVTIKKTRITRVSSI